MNAPSLPHVSLPQIDVHDMTERVQDVAASAAERIEKLPDKAVALAGSVIPALRPARKRSKRPFVLLLVIAAAALGVAWVVRSRRSSEWETADASANASAGDRPVSAVS